jgi:hypothetical protein
VTTEHRALPLDAAAVLAEPVVDVGGVAMRLTASDSVRAGAVAALFRHALPASGAPECLVRFTSDEFECPTDVPVTLLDGLELWRPDAGELTLRSANGLSARVSAHEIAVAGDAPSLAREFRYVAMIALTHVLASRGRHVLHGGAVVCDDRALLVLGGSGTGKSTLVLGALRSGWTALTDDLVAVHRGSDTVLAVGLPRPISVPRDVVFDEFAEGAEVPDDARNRVELPGATLTLSSHPIGGVILVSRGDAAEARVEPVAAHDALRAILGASTSIANPQLVREVFSIAAAVARLPAWSLQHGSDPSSRLHQASLRLEDIRARLGAAAAS